jgi:hypothetical protein
LGAIKPKVLNRIATIGYGHLYLREENQKKVILIVPDEGYFERT